MPLVAQTSATLDLGASWVEYEGFLPSGAATISSTIRYDVPRVSLGGEGSWTVFESGNSIVQATGAGAWHRPLRGDARLELAGALGASKYATAPGSGHVLARTRLHLLRERAGGWLGITTGASLGDSSRVPVELAVTGWTTRERVTLLGNVTATAVGADRYVDLLGTMRWSARGVELETRVGARPWTRTGGGIGAARSRPYGDVSLLVRLGERTMLAVSGGSEPADPVRRLLAADYITAALRLRLAGASAGDAGTLPVPVSDDAAAARLEVSASAHARVLRVRVSAAQSVELMGDFTDWRAVALERTAATTWEIQLPLPPGVYRVNIRIDGGEWIVPAGARAEPSDFGGAVGVLVVR